MQILHDEYQVPLQVNAATITDKQDFFTNRWLSWAIKNDLVDVISSDAHSTKTRKCRMYQSYQIIKDKYGDQAAHDLCINNAAKLLKI